MQLLPFITTLIMLVFTISVFRRYAARRGMHFLFWGIGLAMFGIASFAEAYLIMAWSQWLFYFWFLFGAILNPAYIGQGTLFLLARKRWVSVLAVILVVLSVLTAIMMLRTMPLLNTSAYSAGVPISQQYKTIMPPIAEGGAVRLMPILFGTYGSVTLIGGALYSIWLFWRKRILPNRVIGNFLIAAGALSVAFASVLTGFGYGQFLFAGELIAAILMYWGFILAGRPAVQTEAVAQPSPVGSD